MSKLHILSSSKFHKSVQQLVLSIFIFVGAILGHIEYYTKAPLSHYADPFTFVALKLHYVFFLVLHLTWSAHRRNASMLPGLYLSYFISIHCCFGYTHTTSSKHFMDIRWKQEWSRKHEKKIEISSWIQRP